MSHPTGVQHDVVIQCAASPAFAEWLAQAGGSLIMSTYQAGKVAIIGWDGRQTTLLMRQFDKPLGLAADASRIVLATRHELWILANTPVLAHDYREDQPGRYDALYLPRVTYHTGDLNAHDVAIAGDDIVLVNTRFSCLARLSRDFSFEPLWKPKFVTDVVPEDRCHLNGLAMRDGRPAFVTALGTSDTAGGWREKKADGGVLIEVESNEIVCGGLSMPHSPRWHDGKLWLLNSGQGVLMVVDPATGQSTEVCRLPGYLRGLCFVGPYALVGLCKIREQHIFGGLPVAERYDALHCGVAVIDLRTGARIAMFEYTQGCEELYDVQFVPGVYRPMIVNFDRPEARQAMSNPESSFWLRASSEISEESGTRDGVGVHAAASLSAGGPAGELPTMGNSIPDSGTQR
ncbi:MAG: TIGR03032 family protein [Planctomycetes bacterium]|nr:TIGR03032 family protein [Planctomycetota bacterium]